MHDVIGHVVVAIGDEDLCALDAIAAVRHPFRAGAQRADIGAGLRLGELHGAGPFARHQLFKIGLLQRVAAVGIERLDRAQRQQRTETERDVGRAPDLGAGGIDRERQALSAKRFGTRHRVPPRGRPAPVGIGPAGGGGHLAGFELDAVFVADPVERGQHVGCELASFLEHGGGDVGIEIAVMPSLDGGLQARAVVEGQQHVVDRRAVGHVISPHGLGQAAVFPRNPYSLNSPGGGIRGGIRPRQQPGALCFGPEWRRSCLRNGPLLKCRNQRTPLKWRGTPYRPAVLMRNPRYPAAVSKSLLGRSQAVRQRILIPPFGGSIPPAPANAKLLN